MVVAEEPPPALPGFLLDGIRVVDLAGEPAAATGRILADLGATVVKVEPPGGDPLRSIPPFARDGLSLRFLAWGAGKQSLVVEGPDDPRLAQLIDTADVVIDTPGWPGALSLEPAASAHLVWVSVTPFGLDGPRSRWHASDLGVMASTGNMYCTGDPDRAPLRCREPASYAHVGPEAAFATLTALASGRPQLVDVSIQEAVMIASMGWPGRYGRTGNRGRRSGASIGATREVWPCKDGYVSFGLRAGRARVANLMTITRLVEGDGLATPALLQRDWTTFDHASATREELGAISEPIGAYFARHTMTELYDIACSTGLMLAPVNSPAELLDNAQLQARGFFGRLGDIPHFPLSFVQVTRPDASACRLRPGTPAPSLGSLGSPVWPPRPLPASEASRTESGGHGSEAPHARCAPGPAWSGTRIIEFGTGAAGPIALRYFAEHGATVIRVESRSRPDFLRAYGLSPGNPCGLDGSEMFDALNVGKLSVTLNLKHPEGRALAMRLIGWSDAVVENFAPRALRGLGLDYGSLVTTKPDLVMVSSCLQGQTGPQRDYPGFGGQGSALSGYNFLTGWPDREPVGPYGTITDSLAPRFVATALAAALLYQRRTGRGLHLDVSQVEAAVYSLAPWVLDFVLNGHVARRDGNRSERFAPHGAFRCAGDDRFVAIACTDDEQWQRLAIELGGAALDGRLATQAGRLASVGEVESLVEAWTCRRDAGETAAHLQDLGIEAVAVVDLADAYGDPQLAERGHYVKLHHPCMGECGYERNGFRLRGIPSGYERPSPMLGEHQDVVLGQILGIGPSERRRLAAEGALD